jgi:hypothetical protein
MCLHAVNQTANRMRLVPRFRLKFKRLLIILLACCLVIFAEVAYAWSSGGHRIVAHLAWLQLDNETRVKAVELIKQHERFQEDFADRMLLSVASASEAAKNQWIFVQAATWPDIARNEPQFNHSRWHYVNFPIFLSPEDKEALDLSHLNVDSKLPVEIENEDDLNILQALLLNEKVLQSDSSTYKEKAIHLCWLIHLVGDIHQPLHSTALFSTGMFSDGDGDRGGNQIDVDGTSLHSVWDNLLGNPTTLSNISSRAEDAIDEFRQQGADANQSMEPLLWAQESHQLAEESVYTKAIMDAVREQNDGGGPTVSVSLSPEYMAHAQSIARVRIVEAGFRLAKAIDLVLEHSRK